MGGVGRSGWGRAGPPDHQRSGGTVLTILAAWAVLSVPTALAVGRWLRSLDCCDHPEAG